MANPNYEMLRQAVDRNAAAVLSLPSAGMIRHHKTRFLVSTDDGFWIESAPEDALLIEDLMHSESPVGVAFKAGQTSIVFASPIQQRQAAFRVNETTEVEALFLPFPEAFRQNQRRAAYRVVLPITHEVGLRIWRIAEHSVLRDRPMAAQEIHVRLTNLSVMGMAAICKPSRDGRPPRVQPGERLRIVLECAGTEVLMEGRVIHMRLVRDNHLMVGLQLKKLERDMEGRQALTKLTAMVGDLQRDEIRRRRAVAEAS